MMASAEFALASGGAQRLRVTRRDGQRYAVALDDIELREVARVPNVRQSVALPDGSELVVAWRAGLFGFGEGWSITHAGKPLPGTVGDPQTIVIGAALALFAVALLTAIGGLLPMTGASPFPAVAISGSSLIAGVLMGTLAWLVRRCSLTALLVGMALFAAGTLFGFAHALSSAASSHGAMVGAAFIRIPLFVAMVRAVPVLAKRQRLARAGRI